MNAFEKVERDSYTILEVCQLAGVNKKIYYQMRAAGRGPREMRMGGQVVRISKAAYADWVRQLEADPAIEHREKLKQHSLAAVAGRSV